MTSAVSNLAIGRPKIIFWLTAVLALLAVSQLPQVKIDTDPENMLPVDQPDRVFHNQVEERFTLHDAIVVGIVNADHANGIYNSESLGALHELSAQILKIEGVIRPDLMSLAESDNISQGDEGSIRFEWMMKDAPAGDVQAADIRAKVARLPLLNNTLVSGDARAAAIYVPIERKDLGYPIANEIERLVETIGGPDEYYITGLPVAEETFGVEMFIQMAICAPLAGLMIFLLLWYFFRSWQLVIAPMIVAMATVVITMGLLIGLGFTVHIMSSMIAIFLMPIAVVDSVHIMSEFADRYRADEGAEIAVREVVGNLFTPMLFTSLTSAVGFLSLLLTPIPPVQIFGAFVAFGILLAFVITILFIPAYVVKMKPASLEAMHRAHAAGDADTLLARTLRAAGPFAFRKGKLISVLALMIIVVSVLGVTRIQINDNPVRWFKSDHRIRVADDALNAHFAGTYDAFLVLEYDDEQGLAAFRNEARMLLDTVASTGAELGALSELVAAAGPGPGFDRLISALDDALFDAEPAVVSTLETLLEKAERAQVASRYFQDPVALQTIEGLQQALLDTGLVGKSSALPDVVKVVNRELRGGNEGDYRVPDTAAAVAQTLLQFQSSHRPHDLWHMATPDLRSVAIWLQLTSGDNQHMTAVVDAVAAYLADNPLPPGVTARWAGKTYLNVIWQQNMVAGMLRSLVGAFVAVFIMMSLLFRSVRVGLLAMLPLTITILGVYGLIGWVGKDYDMPIAVLSSLTLGLSVDFAIHFIQRMLSLSKQTGSFASAAAEMFEEPARAISRNAIVIALGFTPLFLSPLVPYITVGAFMASIMAVSGIATLLLLPGLMGWVAPSRSGHDSTQRRNDS